MIALYRISKYDPTYRIHGVYSRNEWTDYSDVGCEFEGKKLTFEQYSLVEQRYVDTAITIAKLSEVDSFEINGLEKYADDCKYLNKQIISVENLEQLLKQCLRNKCWCILLSDECSISFGYDYYMYISTSISKSSVIDTCNAYNLFVGKIEPDKTVVDLFGESMGSS